MKRLIVPPKIFKMIKESDDRYDGYEDGIEHIMDLLLSNDVRNFELGKELLENQIPKDIFLKYINDNYAAVLTGADSEIYSINAVLEFVRRRLKKDFISISGKEMADFPKNLNKFHNITTISLNYITRDIKWIPNYQLPSIKAINIGYGNFVNLTNKFLEAFPNLEDLTILKSKLQKIELLHSDKIKNLTLNGNNLDYESILNLRMLKSLRYLDVSGNNIDYDDYTNIKKLFPDVKVYN